MIARVYEKTNEIELTGSAEELNSLSEKLLIDNSKISLEYKNLDVFLHSNNLESIQVRHVSGKHVKISIEDNSLLIQGSLEKLKILAENIKTGEEKLENYHIHIEYFEGHFFLSKDSTPLIVNFQ